MKNLFYGKVYSILLAVLVLACAPLPAAAEQPGVNQAIVEIDGETVVMQAISMELVEKSVYLYEEKESSSGYNSFGLYGNSNSFSYPTPLGTAQMEHIVFQQLDPRSGLVLKQLELRMPGNWEAGGTYQSEEKDKLYGTPVIKYSDSQTGKSYDSAYATVSSTYYPGYDLLSPGYWIESTNNKSSVALIIDEADSEYSVIKGRFKGDVFTKGGSNHVTFGISSFHVDKNLLPKSTSSPDYIEPLFPDLPESTLDPAPDLTGIPGL